MSQRIVQRTIEAIEKYTLAVINGDLDFAGKKCTFFPLISPGDWTRLFRINSNGKMGNKYSNDIRRVLTSEDVYLQIFEVLLHFKWPVKFVMEFLKPKLPYREDDKDYLMDKLEELYEMKTTQKLIDDLRLPGEQTPFCVIQDHFLAKKSSKFSIVPWTSVFVEGWMASRTFMSEFQLRRLVLKEKKKQFLVIVNIPSEYPPWLNVGQRAIDVVPGLEAHCMIVWVDVANQTIKGCEANNEYFKEEDTYPPVAEDKKLPKELKFGMDILQAIKTAFEAVFEFAFEAVNVTVERAPKNGKESNEDCGLFGMKIGDIMMDGMKLRKGDWFIVENRNLYRISSADVLEKFMKLRKVKPM